MAQPNILRQSICKELHSSFDRGKFLPENCLARLITEANIRLTMPGASPSLINFISQYARKVFATVLCARIDLTGTIEALYADSFTDNFLPIAQEASAGGCYIIGSTSCSHSACINTFHKWSSDDRFAFYERQWQFLALVFTNIRYKHDLNEDCILPFTPKLNTSKDSQFSLVYEVEVHDDHQSVIQMVIFKKISRRDHPLTKGRRMGRNLE